MIVAFSSVDWLIGERKIDEWPLLMLACSHAGAARPIRVFRNSGFDQIYVAPLKSIWRSYEIRRRSLSNSYALMRTLAARGRLNEDRRRGW